MTLIPKANPRPKGRTSGWFKADAPVIIAPNLPAKPAPLAMDGAFVCHAPTIELSGLSVQDAANPEGDIAIELSGLRPGEKLYEELLLGNNPAPTLHPRILKAQEDFLPWAQLEGHLAELELALQHNDVAAIRLLLAHLVPGYTPSEAIVDWVYLEQQAG